MYSLNAHSRLWSRSGAILAVLLLVFVSKPVHGTPDPIRADTWLQRLLDPDDIARSLLAGGKIIFVNIPSFELLAIEDGHEVLRSRVIVGAPDTPTPLVDTHVTSVRFRPTWRPTPSMIGSGEYEDRIWPPGQDNPLGLAAVRLEPPLLVYLHDTNHPEKFDLEDRALSHGCIRVQRWDELVAWTLEIGLPEVHRLGNGLRTIDVPAPPIPVLIRYLTQFPDRRGEIHTYPDIYEMNDTGAAGAHETCPPI